MLYSDYILAVATLLEYDATITNPATATPSSFVGFNTMIPRAIEYAELRIYRELDFLATRTTDATQTSANGSRFITVPTQLVVVEGLNLITPAGLAPDAVGASRVPLIRVRLDLLDLMVPSDVAAAPAFGSTFYALYDEQEATSKVRVGPTPNGAYTAEFLGTFRPAPLTTVNTSTFLTTNLPDIFLAASMVFWTGYQRDFSTQSDDPKMAQSWENQYQLLKQGAAVEEARKKMQTSGGAT